MDFADIVKEIRKQLDVSQEERARELKISFTTINRWENGRGLPSPMVRMRVAEFCVQNDISDELIKALKRT